MVTTNHGYGLRNNFLSSFGKIFGMGSQNYNIIYNKSGMGLSIFIMHFGLCHCGSVAASVIVDNHTRTYLKMCNGINILICCGLNMSGLNTSVRLTILKCNVPCQQLLGHSFA